jgi:hypothetical protein
VTKGVKTKISEPVEKVTDGYVVLPGLAPVDPVFPLCIAPLPEPGSDDPDPDPPLARVLVFVPLGPKALLPGVC